MRYPIWAFFFVLILPPTAVHALLAGKAQLMPRPAEQVAQLAPAPAAPAYWSHTVITR